MTGKLLTTYKQKISDLKLIPASGGAFEISLNGDLIYSKLKTKQFPDEITVLPPFAFFWPTFKKADLELIYDSSASIDLSRAYATHLWESLAWEPYLEHLTPRRVRSIDSNFHRWVRPMIASLPDDYGAPTVTARFALGVRHLKQRVRSAMPLWAARLKPRLFN